MSPIVPSPGASRSRPSRRSAGSAVLARWPPSSASGCGHEAKIEFKSVAEAPDRAGRSSRTVRTIVRVVGQPSFIESYERTSIYPKLTGYIEKWIVDIGDKVKKGDVLATLFVPELVEDFETKKATVELDQANGSTLAQKLVEVAEADVKAAEARVAEAEGDPGQVPGRGRALGLGGQAARAARSTGASSTRRSCSSRRTS